MLTFLLLSSHWIIAMILAIRIINHRLAVGTSLAWLFILFFLPYVGIVAYLLFGESSLGKKREKKSKEIRIFYQAFVQKHMADILEAPLKIDARFDNMSKVASIKTNFFARDGNNIELLAGAVDVFAAMKADIENAKETCLLEFYIIDAQGRAKELLDALCDASARGVECQILADAYGSKGFFKSEWPQKLRDAGIYVEDSLSVGFWRNFAKRSDLRNHRKILAIDSEIAYTGSFNLVDPEFFKIDAGVGEWIDIMLRCRGPVVRPLSAIYYGDLAVENDKSMELTLENVSLYAEKYLAMQDEGDMVAQVIPSGPDQDRVVIVEALVSAFYAAKEKIMITTPYFVPDDAVLLALVNAAHRGVDITIIVPKKVDSKFVLFASHSYYDELLAAGIKIQAFDDGLLHSKIITIDNDFCFVGTVNMDIRSFYLNLEVTIAIYNSNFVAQIHTLIQKYLTQCKKINYDDWQKRPLIKRFIENAVRLTSPFL